MKKVVGRNKETPANKGVPVKSGMAKKGMGKGVKKPMKSPKSTVGY